MFMIRIVVAIMLSSTGVFGERIGANWIAKRMLRAAASQLAMLRCSLQPFHVVPFWYS